MNRDNLKNSLAAFDDFNVIWVGRMEISDREKLLRIKTISMLESEMKKSLSEQSRVIQETGNRKLTLLLISAMCLGLAKKYRSSAEEFIKKYLREFSKNDDISDYTRNYIRAGAVSFMRRIENTAVSCIGDYEKAVKLPEKAGWIARNESMKILNLAVLNGFENDGFNGKKWNTMHDGKSRESHRNADGQIKGLYEPFIVGGSRLMFPCDTSMGAEIRETANCRCVMTPCKI
ncbi:MAG: phage minor head protein [Porcipelethomonas sp.]